MAKQPKKAEIERYKELLALISHHRAKYHEEDAPEITDEAYDSLVRELEELEKVYPTLKTTRSQTELVGGAPSAAFSKVKHSVQQFSFDNVFTEAELREWEERLIRNLEKQDIKVTTVSYVTEHKIDGLKVVLEYKEGKLVRAATRGDGVIGEDITHTVRTIGDVPETLKDAIDITVVGEAWLGEDEFERINKKRTKDEKPLFANPRNAAAGSLRQLDPEVTKGRSISFFAYDIDVLDTLGTKLTVPTTQWDELALLETVGLRVNSYKSLCESIDDVVCEYNTWVSKKRSMDYGMDGLVVKVNDISLQKALGHTAKAPRYGIAFKFPSEQATTVVEDIQLQLGRTGVLTPVAHLRPVLIAGSTVSRATLHNEDQIQRLDVRVGDTVVLQKAGDVIPEIVSVVSELRPNTAQPYRFPKKVAECGGDGSIERIPGEAAYRCVAKDSETLHRERLYYFVSKAALNIDGVGPRIIDLLLDHNLINTYVDLFTLEVGDLRDLPGFQEKAARNVIDAITAARNTPLHRLLVGLSIEHVGEETARLIASHFGTIETIERASEAELAAIHGVGDIVAESVHNWFSDKGNRTLLKRLLKHITVVAPETVATTGALAGKTMVFTGTLKTLTRGEAEELARKNGAHVTSSVSKNTDYVIAGSDAGSKEEKAKKLGVAILTEREFQAML